MKQADVARSSVTMADDTSKTPSPTLTSRNAAARAAKVNRLAAALRENLKRRKDQERGREGDADRPFEIKSKD